MSGNKPMCIDVAPLTNIITLTAIIADGTVVHYAHATANIAVVSYHCTDCLGSIKYINWLQKGIKKGHIWNELRTIPGQGIVPRLWSMEEIATEYSSPVPLSQGPVYG
jgi:hypothetical protein